MTEIAPRYLSMMPFRLDSSNDARSLHSRWSYESEVGLIR